MSMRSIDEGWLLVSFPPSFACLFLGPFPLRCPYGLRHSSLPQIGALWTGDQVMCSAPTASTPCRLPLCTLMGAMALGITYPTYSGRARDVHGPQCGGTCLVAGEECGYCGLRGYRVSACHIRLHSLSLEHVTRPCSSRRNCTSALISGRIPSHACQNSAASPSG